VVWVEGESGVLRNEFNRVAYFEMAKTKTTFTKGHKFYPGAKGSNGQLRRDMTVELISQLNEICAMPGSNEQRENMHWVIKALIENAKAGDNTAILGIFDRLEGKPAQKLVGPDNGPVQVQFKTANDVRVYLIQRGLDIDRLPAPVMIEQHDVR
jgi:hypothetical protein